MSTSDDPNTLQPPSRGHRSGGRPTKSETAQLSEDLRAAALDLFLAHGYDATSIAAIAGEARTTKAAVYGRFDDKESIFVDVVEWVIGRSDWPIAAVRPVRIDDLEGSLRSIAATSVERATDPSMVRLMRAVAAQAARFPDLARKVFDASWSDKEFLILLLQHHGANGAIVADEPEVLAENFLTLVAAGPAHFAAFGVRADVTAQERYVEEAIELFLRGVRPG